MHFQKKIKCVASIDICWLNIWYNIFWNKVEYDTVWMSFFDSCPYRFMGNKSSHLWTDCPHTRQSFWRLICFISRRGTVYFDVYKVIKPVQVDIACFHILRKNGLLYLVVTELFYFAHFCFSQFRFEYSLKCVSYLKFGISNQENVFVCPSFCVCQRLTAVSAMMNVVSIKTWNILKCFKTRLTSTDDVNTISLPFMVLLF